MQSEPGREVELAVMWRREILKLVHEHALEKSLLYILMCSSARVCACTCVSARFALVKCDGTGNGCKTAMEAAWVTGVENSFDQLEAHLREGEKELPRAVAHARSKSKRSYWSMQVTPAYVRYVTDDNRVSSGWMTVHVLLLYTV